MLIDAWSGVGTSHGLVRASNLCWTSCPQIGIGAASPALLASAARMAPSASERRQRPASALLLRSKAVQTRAMTRLAGGEAFEGGHAQRWLRAARDKGGLGPAPQHFGRDLEQARTRAARRPRPRPSPSVQGTASALWRRRRGQRRQQAADHKSFECQDEPRT